MPRKRVFLTCLESFLLLAAVFAFFSRNNVSYGLVLNVPDSYPTIQEAITAASAGDTINVSRRSGEAQSVYSEKLVIDKQVTLVGESRETVIIDGTGTGTVIRIQADNVEIRGFTIRNGGSMAEANTAGSEPTAIPTQLSLTTLSRPTNMAYPCCTPITTRLSRI
jgi:nitrous oxidase accessory protein NosD